MLESGKIINLKALGCTSGATAIDTKDISNNVSSMVKDIKSTHQVIYTKVTSFKAKNMATVSIFGKMEVTTKALSSKIYVRAKVYGGVTKAISTMGNTKMAKNKDMGFMSGPMELSTKVILKMIYVKVLGRFTGQMERSTKAAGTKENSTGKESCFRLKKDIKKGILMET